ncbi:ribonuclease H-like domain-containing protein [Mycena rebaudengoi]|nr:ribonuclease H-like domain-containing protein [Mycena rebaudengoi]
MTNENEQIRQMLCTPTDHNHHIERPLQGTARSLHEHGHPPMSLLWTDNVAADPSTIHLIDEACLSIMADVGDETSGKIIVVGFSLEWDWRASEAGHFPAAMMQISWQNTVNLLQIYLVQKPQQVPESLKALLLSKRVIKVGYHVQGNLDLLSMLWELRSSPDQRINTRATGWVDIGALAKSKGLIPHTSTSFSRISEAVLRRNLDDQQDLRCSHWCRQDISADQRLYAARNAWVSLEIYKAIVDRPPAGARLSRMGLPGEKVTLRNGDINVAHGIFAVQPTKIAVSESDPDTKYITISRTKRAVITIQQILAQSFISHYHQRSLEDMGPPPFDMAVDLVSLIAREEYTMQNQPGLLSQTNPAPMDVDSTSVKPPEFGDSVSEMDWEAGSELRL